MPVSFLTPEHREAYGRFNGAPSPEDLTRFFHLDDTDQALIAEKRGDANPLGYALQLTTVRYLGTFLDDPIAVPEAVLRTLSRQLRVTHTDALANYGNGRRRMDHAAEICRRLGYREFAEASVGFRLARWLYALCWTGTERPGVLFERATGWMLAHKVLLPGATLLERFVARLRDRVEMRLWRLLARDIGPAQRASLEALLAVPEGRRSSVLDKLRTGPVRVSGPSLVQALLRLQSVRELGISLPAAARISPSRIASLARFAGTAKAGAIGRLPPVRRLATLVAFVHSLEASAQDDALEVLDMLLHELFGAAMKADKKARLRTIKDLDLAASTLAQACAVVLDPSLPDEQLRERLFATVPRERLSQALTEVNNLVRPPDNVFYEELDQRYKTVRGFLPMVLRHLHFQASPAGQPVAAALIWLAAREQRPKSSGDAPHEVVRKSWLRYIDGEHGKFDLHAYTFCVLDELHTALRRRDVFVSPSWRYADPRAGLLDGAEWDAARPIICRSLGLSATAEATLTALSRELDRTYRAVAARLPENGAVRISEQGLVLGKLDELEEPASLKRLKELVAARLPRVDLPEILLEIAARTGFTEAFTHVSERTARAADLTVSLCAVLLGQACNTGPVPLIRSEVPALKRDRLSWVDQNYLRDETITAANAVLVGAQSRIELALAWGGGEVASADGMRFVVPVRTVHAGPNPKYFGPGRGVTWYNLISDQFSGLNAVTVPGTMRDSLVLLAVVLEQQTELQPTQIMTDTGAYSDVVFGLFRLLGYRFSPRLADIGGARFWRIDPQADYGPLDVLG